jgi:hypothetical protein
MVPKNLQKESVKKLVGKEEEDKQKTAFRKLPLIIFKASSFKLKIKKF